MVKLRTLLAAAGLATILAVPAIAAEAPKPPAQKWSFDGFFGTYDRAALQRGFQPDAVVGEAVALVGGEGGRIREAVRRAHHPGEAPGQLPRLGLRGRRHASAPGRGFRRVRRW